MTKLRWEKSKRYNIDPGSVVDIGDEGSPRTPTLTFQEQQEVRKREHEAVERLLERSDQLRLRAINKKRKKVRKPPLSTLPD